MGFLFLKALGFVEILRTSRCAVYPRQFGHSKSLLVTRGAGHETDWITPLDLLMMSTKSNTQRRHRWSMVAAMQLISSLSLAGSMGASCTAVALTTPCASPWAIGIEGLLLKPVVEASSPTYNKVNSVNNDVTADWNLGYRLIGAYGLASGNVFAVNWSHISNPTTKGLGDVFVNQAILPTNPTSKTNFDQVNAVGSQTIRFSKRSASTWYMGLQYASMRAMDGFYYDYIDASTDEHHYINESFKTNFAGIGPTLGSDFSYALWEGLSVTANASASLLTGTTHTSAQATDQSDLLVAPDTVSTVVQSAYSNILNVVPSLEARLGLRYDRSFLMGTLSFDGGYQALQYFHPLSGYRNASENTPSLFFSDFGLYGPYFGLRWQG